MNCVDHSGPGLYIIHNHNEDKRPRVHANCCVKNSYQNFGPPRPAGPPHCGVCGVTIYATADTPASTARPMSLTIVSNSTAASACNFAHRDCSLHVMRSSETRTADTSSHCPGVFWSVLNGVEQLGVGPGVGHSVMSTLGFSFTGRYTTK